MGETFDFDAVLKKARGRKADGQKAGGDLEDRVALNFADQYAAHFRFIAKWGRWMLFDGWRWQHEDTLVAFDKARVLCREAEDTKAKTVAAVVALARTDRAIAATDEQWETDHWIFNILTEDACPPSN
jgi:hypothetical protein